MWDDAALKEAGLDELAGRTDARDAAGPATSYGVRGDRRHSVVIEDGREGERAPQGAGKRTRSGGGLSWPITMILALALGLAVYFLVRMLR